MGATVSFPVLGIELTLRRVAFSLFGIEVYWYGLLIALGTVLAVLYAFKKLDEFGLDQDRVIDVILVGTICAVVGSRLYYIIFSAPGEFNSLREALDIRRGGVAFYGSVIGAFASAVISCRIKQLKLRPVADLAAIGFLIGQCVGRWGNFINQEAFGGNTSLPWGMTSQHISQYLRLNQLSLEARGMQIDPLMPVHPTFLYESLWCLLGLILLTLYIKRRMYDGEIFLMYLAWNGAGRSVIEGLRTDSLYLGTVRISQLLAFVGFITAVLAIMVIRKNVSDKRKEDPEFAIPYGHTEQYQIDKAELAEQREKNITDKKAGKKAGAEPEEDDAEDDDEWDDDEEDSDEESADEEESDEEAKADEEDEPGEQPDAAKAAEVDDEANAVDESDFFEEDEDSGETVEESEAEPEE